VKPQKPDLTVQLALNNCVALLHPLLRPTKKPWLREYASALLQPALDSMADEVFTTEELQCILVSLCLILEVRKTGNFKLAPAIDQAKDLI
jgi:hypothetical protein